MAQLPKKTKQLIIIGVAGMVLVGLLIFVLTGLPKKNQYGEEVKIQNYSEFVKNLPARYEESITASLYDMINYNSKDQVSAGSVKDAIIRSGSADQKEITAKKQYTGTFIVDIASLKQSYRVQYEFSEEPDATVLSGYGTLVSCLGEQDLIYGDFGCRSLYNSDYEEEDPIVGLLPQTTLSYKLSAQTGGDKLMLYADLRIPQMDLKGDLASRRAAVALYKGEVTKWMTDRGFNPADYNILYNYTDDGESAIGHWDEE